MARWSMEFPRISPAYKTKVDSEAAPWGNKSNPVQFDHWQESTLTNLHSCDQETTLGGSTFEKGIWYYTGIPLSDH